MFSKADHEFMARAIKLAQQGRFSTSPNPNVGCVLVKNGEIIGEGFHQVAGQGHAEVNALADAAMRAQNVKGATAYVTLEPCSHHGKTPPCADALVNAGVARVVAAMVDPNPAVAGRGMKRLQQAGIEAQSGLLTAQAEQLNLGFLKRMRSNMPFVSCKLAASLDGKTALKNGSSKWITSSDARNDVQQLRAQACAIISGADTVLVDNAQLNVRMHFGSVAKEVGIRQPLRVIIDTNHRLTPELALFAQPSPIIIIRTSQKGIDNSVEWPHFVEQLTVEASSTGKACLTDVLKQLAKKQVNHVLVEAGKTLAGQFAAQNLIDEFIFYLAPKLMGAQSQSLLELPEFTAMNQALELEFRDLRQVGADLRITARVKN